MSGFEDREKVYEKQHVQAEKLSFDVEARLSKLYGLWAAEKLGLSGNDANTYAMSVVDANLEEPGFDDILRKVRADFDDKELDISDDEMNKELNKALEQAKIEIAKKNEE